MKNNKVAKYILKRLGKREATQTELARYMGISRQLLHYKLKTGKFSLVEMSRLSKFFGNHLSQTFYEIERGR